MIEQGLEALAEQRCPYCGNTHFLRGPSGGRCVNIECAHCGQRYNVVTWEGRLLMAQLMAQRIAYNGYWMERGDWTP